MPLPLSGSCQACRCSILGEIGAAEAEVEGQIVGGRRQAGCVGRPRRRCLKSTPGQPTKRGWHARDVWPGGTPARSGGLVVVARDERRGRPDVRARLVQVGIDALLELEPVDLLGAIGTREVARRAGVASSTFFEHFTSARGFADAVVERVYAVAGAGTISEVPLLTRSVASSEQALGQVYGLHRADFERIRNDPEFRVRLGLWALGGAKVDEVYRRYLAQADEQLIAGAELLFASWGRELRPPFDAKGYVAALVALVQGAVLRSIVDPDRLPVDLFERASAALPVVALRPLGDRRTFDDRLAEMNYYTLWGERTRAKNSERRLEVSARILRAAGGLFAIHGFDGTTVAAIARKAGVHPDTVHAHFPGKAAIATELFEIALGPTPDRVSGSGPLDHLRSVLDRLAAQVGGYRDLAAQYAISVLGAQRARTDGDLMAVVNTLIVEATDSGDLRADIDPSHLSRTLVLSIVSEMMERPATPPATVAFDAFAMCIDGARR